MLRDSGQTDMLAFDHVLEKLRAQRDDIARIRGWASVSSAMTGLIAAFFSAVVGSDHLPSAFSGSFFLGFNAPAVLLLVIFGASIAMSALVVTSREEFHFSFNARRLRVEGRRKSSEEFYRYYVKDGEWYFNDNEKKIGRAQSQLLWAIMLGWAQIFPWLLLI